MPTFKYLFRNELKLKNTSVETIVRFIRTGRHAKQVNELQERVRYCVANGIKDNVASDSTIPVINWAVNKDGFTGHVLISLPFGDNWDLLARLRVEMKALQQVLCAYTGASGRTLKVVMPYTLRDGTLPATELDAQIFYATAHRRAVAFLLQLTGIQAEAYCGDVMYGSRISSDADVFYNPDAVAVPMDMPKDMPQTMLSSPRRLYKANTLPDYNTLQMEVTKFAVVCRKIGFTAESVLDENIMELASECRRAGITEEVAVKCVIYMGEMRKYETMIRTAFNAAYAEGHMGERNMFPSVLMNQILLRHFLEKRYLFRRNVITGSIEYMERSTHLTSWHQLSARIRNTICLNAQMAGIEAWDKDISRYLDSTMVIEHDPIGEWLSQLPAWDGKDRVADVAACVKTDNEKWADDFALWLRSMVSQWMGRGGLYGSCIVLLLTGGQGTGKSTFFKRLVPKALFPYYTDRIDFSNKREAERALMRFGLICMDEFDQITKSQTAYLKHIIQKSDIKWRKMYQDEIEQRQRFAAFCATTNSPTPLTDPTGSRRYLCVSVLDRIDNTLDIDHEQLFAQIVAEIRNGLPTYFSAEDEARIQEHNKDFYQEQPLETILRSYITMPEHEDDGEWMSSLQIAQEIRRIVKGIRTDSPTINNIGKILSNNGIQRKRTHNGNKYLIHLNA